jgi:hypothetical protein
MTMMTIQGIVPSLMSRPKIMSGPHMTSIDLRQIILKMTARSALATYAFVNLPARASKRPAHDRLDKYTITHVSQPDAYSQIQLQLWQKVEV